VRLIVGLGNPGKKYEKTRHNIGFRVVDALAKKLRDTDYNLQSKLFKPQSYMNLSGPEVFKKLNYYRLAPTDLIVIYDDIDLPLGEIRVRNKGSSAGHKGVQSIIDIIGSENFTRVRVGVGRPPENVPAEKYVLQNFDTEEGKLLPKIIDDAVKVVVELVK